MVRVFSTLIALASAAAYVLAQTRVEAMYEVDSNFRGHTIYRPRNMSSFSKIPVVIWGNGACSANSLSHVNFNLEVASWGILLIAQGEPNASGGTSESQYKQAIDWITRVAGTGIYANVDARNIAAAGMSCGGTEAYSTVPDSRITAYGIFNSGNLDSGTTSRIVPQINVPIFFFLGGTGDIAYPNGMRDYNTVKSGVPTWMGNLPVGHGGTYGDARGGKFGTAGQSFFRWVLRGDTSAASFFTGNGAQADGWSVMSKSLQNVPPPRGGGSSSTTQPPVSTTPSSTPSSSSPAPTTTQPSGNCSAQWGQCGGTGWTGPTCCVSGTTCTYSNPWYSQCL